MAQKEHIKGAEGEWQAEAIGKARNAGSLEYALLAACIAANRKLREAA